MKEKSSERPGRLFLVPTPIAEGDPRLVLPPATIEAILPLRSFAVENEKSAWRFLSAVLPREALSEVSLSILDEHSTAADLPRLAEPLAAGRDMGLMSEAGCPGIADPGASLVAAAHALGAAVIPLVGPSAIIMALMASGMNGQAFSFHGYLPRDRQERRKALRALEKAAAATGASQAFIEAPYRNAHMVEDLSSALRPDTPVLLASGIGGPGALIVRRPAAALASAAEGMGKQPTVFVIGRP